MGQTTAITSAVMAGCATAELEDFDALVRSEQRRVYRVLLAMVRDPDAADSLTQECFLKAYRHRHRFRGECTVRTWLLRIAVNLARDHAKSRRAQFWRKLFDKSPDPAYLSNKVDPRASPERQLLAREDLAAVWSAVDDLPAQQRAIFVLRFVEDLSTEEIAAATSLRPGTVKTHLFRALSAVRDRMKGRQDR
jgi:RNA polymerase sigma-70 factor (ECF subfamily)